MSKTPSARANEVWRRFAGIYGAPLLEQTYGPTPPPDWQAAIDRLDKTEIDRAIAVCRNTDPIYLPKLGQFERAAKPPAKPTPQASTATVAEQLTAFVANHYHRRLTDLQLALGWTFVYRKTTSFNDKGVEVPGRECVAVEIEQLDGEQGFRITVDDMAAVEEA